MARDNDDFRFHTVGGRQYLLSRYLMENTCKDYVVTRKQIFDYLFRNGIEIDRKTLYTDMEFLRSIMKIDVVFDQKRNGYYVKNPTFAPYELRLMVDSIQASKFITQAKARELCHKIEALTDRHTRATLNRQAYVAERVRSMNDSVVTEADCIHEAIAANEKVSFRYFHYTYDKKKQYSKQGERYLVSPYALLWDNGNHYLYAFDGAKFRYFRVDRMESIRHIPTEREGKEQYSVKDATHQKAKVFQMFAGAACPVRLRFRSELADAVIDQFGKDVMMVPADDEHFTVTVPVEVSPPFYAWVASFGRRAKILAPAEAVKGMRDFIEKVSDMYKDDGNV